jgi:two-component system, NtrC family, response regulator HydG
VSESHDAFGDGATVKRDGLSTAPRATSYLLTVSEGDDRGATLRVEPNAPSRVLAGTSPSCELRLTDRQVSRRHAAFEIVGRRLRVTDLGSTNGTFADGLEVSIAYLRGGETIRLGSTAIRVANETQADEPLADVSAFGRLLGASPAMRRLYPLCARLAATNVPVIIEGETGTGKEQLAEALHEAGPRADRPYVVLDCTTIAPSLIESELFGHERGAFTGASGPREGVFERADGGTLLIDEIGDLPLELQPKLLRAIERSVITRVGGSTPIRVDVRLLAATRRDLDREVQLGRFRDDLFHRVAVARIELPPLRERAGDVRLLARRFWAELGGNPDAIPVELLRRWEDYPWPGNVRDLRNAVARRLALGDLADLDAQPSGGGSVPSAPSGGDAVERAIAKSLPYTMARDMVLDDFERRYAEHLVERHGGNVTKAAAAAGVSRRYLQKLRAKP